MKSLIVIAVFTLLACNNAEKKDRLERDHKLYKITLDMIGDYSTTDNKPKLDSLMKTLDSLEKEIDSLKRL